MQNATGNLSPGKMRILLVEDMKLNRDIVVMLLEREGYEVTATSSGLEALQALTEHVFAGVLLDIRMPKMDGITAVKIIRSCEQGQVPVEQLPYDLADRLVMQLNGRTTPIIVMTASRDLEDKKKGLLAGADAFMAKPFTPKDLLSTIEMLLSP